MTRRRRGRAAVVVVGDVGRSPRMQYHALSLANQKVSFSAHNNILTIFLLTAPFFPSLCSTPLFRVLLFAFRPIPCSLLSPFLFPPTPPPPPPPPSFPSPPLPHLPVPPPRCLIRFSVSSAFAQDSIPFVELTSENSQKFPLRLLKIPSPCAPHTPNLPRSSPLFFPPVSLFHPPSLPRSPPLPLPPLRYPPPFHCQNPKPAPQGRRVPLPQWPSRIAQGMPFPSGLSRPLYLLLLPIKLIAQGMPFPSGLSRPLYLLLLPIKLIAQVLCFLWVLCVATPPPDFYPSPALSLPIKLILQVLCFLWVLCIATPPPDIYLLQCAKRRSPLTGMTWVSHTFQTPPDPSFPPPPPPLAGPLPSPSLSQTPCRHPHPTIPTTPSLLHPSLLPFSPSPPNPNPPTIPTFTVVRFAGLVRRASFVIDWHNFGFTLFGLRFGPAHPLVKIHKWYETTIARQAAAHICVTRAMQQELANNWDIRATVLYDRPPAFFRPSTLEEMREVCMGWERPGIGSGAHRPITAQQLFLPTRTQSAFSSPHLAAPYYTSLHLTPHHSVHHTIGLSDQTALPLLSAALAGEWPFPSHVDVLLEAALMTADEDFDVTADEDFDVLLEAALMYDRRVAAMAGEGEFGGEGGGEGERGAAGGVPLLDSKKADGISASAVAAEAATAAAAAAGAAGVGGDSSSAGSRKEGEGEGERGGAVTTGAAGVGASGGRLKSGAKFPTLAFIVTGKGALRSHYEAKMRRLRLRHVSFRTAWLAPEDYPRLLGSADLGVSLHTSSSGLDLPMKVVDMFGCGLPVCAISYSCIHELVKDGTNGLLFSDSSELASQLIDIFCGFPEGSAALKAHSPATTTTYSSTLASSSSSGALSTPPMSPTSPSSTPSSVTLLQKLRSGALATGAAGKWADEWSVNVLPLVERLSGGDLRGVMR
ncbi:unnamed protein product [Closterium sp. NIES-64]|nr:unnamed protein product [Closterium sp. NIES-64]